MFMSVYVFNGVCVCVCPNGCIKCEKVFSLCRHYNT